MTPRWIEIVRPASRRPRFVGCRDQIMEYAYYEMQLCKPDLTPYLLFLFFTLLLYIMYRF